MNFASPFAICLYVYTALDLFMTIIIHSKKEKMVADLLRLPLEKRTKRLEGYRKIVKIFKTQIYFMIPLIPLAICCHFIVSDKSDIFLLLGIFFAIWSILRIEDIRFRKSLIAKLEAAQETAATQVTSTDESPAIVAARVRKAKITLFPVMIVVCVGPLIAMYFTINMPWWLLVALSAVCLMAIFIGFSLGQKRIDAEQEQRYKETEPIVLGLFRKRRWQFYVRWIIGIILSIWGFAVTIVALWYTIAPGPTDSLGTSIFVMIVLGILPFIGGIALCALAGKRWIIGIILSLFGIVMIVLAVGDMSSSPSDLPLAANIAIMIFVGILPLAGGIALCIHDVKKRRRSKIKYQANSGEKEELPKNLFPIKRFKILLLICLLLLVPIILLYVFNSPITAVDYNNRGVEAYNQSNYDEAIADYNQAINLDPNYAKAYNNRGAVYYKLDDFEKAIADYNQAINLDPNYALFYWNRGDLQQQLGHNDEAMTDFHKCLTLNPDASTRQKVEAALQQLEVNTIIFSQ